MARGWEPFSKRLSPEPIYSRLLVTMRVRSGWARTEIPGTNGWSSIKRRGTSDTFGKGRCSETRPLEQKLQCTKTRLSVVDYDWLPAISNYSSTDTRMTKLVLMQREFWVTQRKFWVTQREFWVTQRKFWVTQREFWVAYPDSDAFAVKTRNKSRTVCRCLYPYYGERKRRHKMFETVQWNNSLSLVVPLAVLKILVLLILFDIINRRQTKTFHQLKTLQCGLFDRVSVSYSEINWQKRFNLIRD